MKILIVSSHPTHPGIEGNRRFIFNQVELFKRMGHDVYFLLVRVYKGEWVGDKQEVISLMRDYWGDHLFLYEKTWFFLKKKRLILRYRKLFNHGYLLCDDYYPNGLENVVNQLNRKYNFRSCIINYYTYSKLFLKVDIPLKALTTHDIFTFKDILTDDKNAWQATTANQEAIAMQRCPHIFALNSEEAVFFSKLSPKSKVYNVYSTYVYKQSSLVGTKNILFLSGNNIYNQNGIIWFLENIFPSIVKEFPDLKLIIGGGISKYVESLGNNTNIEICGYVDDADAFYSQGDIVINPTYQGTGLKIKTFEAIAYDKVVMAHPHSTIGIYKPDECPAFISTKATEWVEALKKIWSDKRQILYIKDANKKYINQMNEFIMKEYNRFFKSLEA